MTDSTLESPRLRAALDLLTQAGFPGCGAAAGGPGGEVLVLTVPESAEEMITGAGGEGLRARLRDVGFRYVALDLAPRSDSP